MKLSRIFIYLSMAFNSYHLPNAYLLWIWSLISFLYTTEKYLHSTPCPWQVILIIVVELLDHLHFFGCCFGLSAFIAKLIYQTPFVFLVSFWTLVCSTQICFVLYWVGKSNDPILVHLHSKVILLDNALFLGKLSYFV